MWSESLELFNPSEQASNIINTKGKTKKKNKMITKMIIALIFYVTTSIILSYFFKDWGFERGFMMGQILTFIYITVLTIIRKQEEVK